MFKEKQTNVTINHSDLSRHLFLFFYYIVLSLAVTTGSEEQVEGAVTLATTLHPISAAQRIMLAEGKASD